MLGRMYVLRYNIRTMKKYISAMVLTAYIAVLFPQATQAYFTSEQTAVRLTPITAMYTITYSFGLPKQDIYLPITTERNLSHKESERTLGYTMREDGKEIINEGRTAALVFSNAEIKNGMYFVPAGSSRTFTLVAFLRTQEDTPEADYVLQVENLPFLVDIDEEELQIRGLNPSELIYYATGEIELNGDGEPSTVSPVKIDKKAGLEMSF